MTELRDTNTTELPVIFGMEQGEVGTFVVPYSLQKHQEEFEKPTIVYKSIWRLDVFEFNERARQLYERAGYRRFGESSHAGRTLLLYETTA